jgi:CHAD domain-containing protein
MEKSSCPQFLVEALEERWQSYFCALTAVRAAFSSKAVKNFRTAGRQLLAVLDILDQVSSQPSLQQLRQACKEQLDSLGELRDVQMILAEVDRNADHFLALQRWQPALRQHEQQLQHAAAENLAAFELEPLRHHMRKAQTQLAAGVKLNSPTALLQTVDKAYQKVLKRQAQLDPAVITSFHRLRLALKKFRYRVETVHPLAPAYPPELFNALRQYQNALGAIQDSDVFLLALNAFAATLPEGRTAIVRAEYEKQRARLLTEFTQAPRPLAGFWRPAGDKPFPWTLRTRRRKTIGST